MSGCLARLLIIVALGVILLIVVGLLTAGYIANTT